MGDLLFAFKGHLELPLKISGDLFPSALRARVVDDLTENESFPVLDRILFISTSTFTSYLVSGVITAWYNISISCDHLLHLYQHSPFVLNFLDKNHFEELNSRL